MVLFFFCFFFKSVESVIMQGSFTCVQEVKQSTKCGFQYGTFMVNCIACRRRTVIWRHDSRVLLLLLLYVLYQAAAGHSLQSAWLVLTCLWPHFPGRPAWVTGRKPHCCWAIIAFLFFLQRNTTKIIKKGFCIIEPSAVTRQWSFALLSAIEATRISAFLLGLDIRGATQRGHPSVAFTRCSFDGLASDSESGSVFAFPRAT